MIVKKKPLSSVQQLCNV